MEKSHVAGWTSASPTPAQLKEFFAQLESGRITRSRFQQFLRGTTEVEKDDEFFATATLGLSLNELRANDRRGYIVSYLQGSPALDRKGAAGRSLSVRMSPLPGSFEKTTQQQLSMVRGGIFPPEAWDLVASILAYVDATNVWPFTNCSVRTATVTDGGRRLVVCCRDGRVRIGDVWDGDREGDLGIAVARNS